MITLTPHTLCGSGSASGLQLCCVLQTLGDSGPCCGDGGPRYTLQLALNCSVNRRGTRKHQFCRCPSFYLQLWFSALRGDWQRTITLVCSVWASDRNTAHLKQFFRFIQTFLHRLNLICESESETCNRVRLDFMISCIIENIRELFCSDLCHDEFIFHYRTCSCWWRTWDQSRSKDNIFARTTLDFISRPVQNHHGLIPQSPVPVSDRR